LFNLFRAPFKMCRSQSSGYHALSRIIIKIKINTYGLIMLCGTTPIGIEKDL
jgi:hypothetical protein